MAEEDKRGAEGRGSKQEIVRIAICHISADKVNSWEKTSCVNVARKTLLSYFQARKPQVLTWMRAADPDAARGSDLCVLSFEQQQRGMNLASLTSFFPSFSVSYLLNSSALSLSVWTLTRPSCCPAVQAALQ